jgi:hypothetical protein
MSVYDDPNREAVGLAPIWTGAGDDTATATGATAGTPGTWTPPGSDPAESPATMAGITASPATAWATGEYVQTGTSGAAGQVYWDGSAWLPGSAAAADETTTSKRGKHQDG